MAVPRVTTANSTSGWTSSLLLPPGGITHHMASNGNGPRSRYCVQRPIRMPYSSVSSAVSLTYLRMFVLLVGALPSGPAPDGSEVCGE